MGFNLDGVIFVGVLYGLVYSCLRLLVSDNLPVDDVKANVYTQTLELGYMAKQPPLYEWLLWLVQNFTGPTCQASSFSDTACWPRPLPFSTSWQADICGFSMGDPRGVVAPHAVSNRVEPA